METICSRRLETVPDRREQVHAFYMMIIPRTEYFLSSSFQSLLTYFGPYFAPSHLTHTRSASAVL